MAALTQTSIPTSAQSLGRNIPFRSAQRPLAAPRLRTVAVCALQGPNEVVMRTLGAVTAAQLALLPLVGAATADILPDSAKSQSARDAVNKAADNAPSVGQAAKNLAGSADLSDAPDLQKEASKGASNAKSAAKDLANKGGNPLDSLKGKLGVGMLPSAHSLTIGNVGNPAGAARKAAQQAGVPNPADTLAAKAKQTANKAKQIAPDPVKELDNISKQATKNAKNLNPAKDFAKNANKGKQLVQSAPRKAKANIANPAREFAAKNLGKGSGGAKRAVNAVKNAGNKLPLAAIGFDTDSLRTDVLFGIGGKAKQTSDKVKAAANEVSPSQDTADAGEKSFSIFNQDSVTDAKNALKQNVNDFVGQQKDPAERVASIGKPGESQEENAERIRREAENNNVTGGDARAPTN